MPDVLPINVPPREAVEYFRRKDMLRSFAWESVYAEEHARVFTVAKAMELDILQDIRAAVDEAIAEGTTLRDFRRQLEPTLQRKGWWGRQVMVDPDTGEEALVQLGSPRRLRTIYETNLRTSYAAGAWERIQRTKEARPYLRYVAILDEATRDRHRAWHGTVLPVDHPWWETHYPPNGWGCRCSVQQLSERDLERFGYEVSSSPPDTGATRVWVNPRTGEERRVPVGIDPGWDYHVGAAGGSHARAFQLLAEKSAAADADLAAALWSRLSRREQAVLDQEFADWADALIEKRRFPQGELQRVGALSPRTVDYLRGRGIEPASGVISIVDKDFMHLVRDKKASRGLTISAAQARRLPALLRNPRAILYDKTTPRTLLFVFDAPPGEERLGKLVVRVNYQTKVKADGQGKRGIVLNSIRTAGLVKRAELVREAIYEVIEGAP